MDRFPLLLIATALRALKAQGKELWDKYDNGDNLLFKESDLLSPLQSRLFLDLTKTGDPVISRMMAILVKALRGSLETVPLLEEVMPDAPAGATVVPRMATRPAPATASTRPPRKARRPHQGWPRLTRRRLSQQAGMMSMNPRRAAS